MPVSHCCQWLIRTQLPCPALACSLELGGTSLLHFTSFLPLCRRLEVLDMCLSVVADEDEQLLCTHLW